MLSAKQYSKVLHQLKWENEIKDSWLKRHHPEILRLQQEELARATRARSLYFRKMQSTG